MIKAVLFDCDGVLINSFEANFIHYTGLLHHIGVREISREEYSKIFHLSLRDNLKRLMKGRSVEEIQKAFDWAVNRAKTVYRHDLLKTPKGLKKTIETLHGKYVLAVVTSRMRGRVFGVPILSPFEKYFKVGVYYEDTEKHKPDPEPLLLAATRLNLKPEECVYVGDAKTDQLAAEAAGMKIIIYSKTKPDDDTPWTSKFSDIPHLIGTLF